jgi:hypothetical protein
MTKHSNDIMRIFITATLLILLSSFGNEDREAKKAAESSLTATNPNTSKIPFESIPEWKEKHSITQKKNK